MKAYKFILGFALMFGLLFSTQAQGQAVIVRDQVLYLNAFGELGIPSLSSQQVTSPSGNHNLAVDFQLPEGNMYIPSEEEGEVSYPLAQWLYGLWWEGEIYVNSDGKVKVRLRSKKL